MRSKGANKRFRKAHRRQYANTTKTRRRREVRHYRKLNRK